MGMPQIPEGTYRPSSQELLIDLLESVALDHMSLSHVINAQGELMQEITTKWCCDEIDYNQLVSSFESTTKMLDDVIMKEWLLQKRLNTIMDASKSLLPPTPGSPPSPPCPPGPGKRPLKGPPHPFNGTDNSHC